MKGHDGALLRRDDGMPPDWRAYWLALSRNARADVLFLKRFCEMRHGGKMSEAQAILFAICYAARRLEDQSPISDAGEEGGPPW